MKKKFTSTTALIIAVIMMAICVIGTMLTDSNFGKAKVSVFYGTLAELADEIDKNNEENGKNIEIHFTRDKKNDFMFKLMAPKAASAENPVPLIVCSHGGSSTKETEQAYYTELVRRGFAVITIEAHGNGHTDTGLSAVSGDGFGMLPAVEYGMSLDFVDETKVGITGHSAGNSASTATLNILNVEGSTQRIRAYVTCDGDGNPNPNTLGPDKLKDMIFVLGNAGYGEFNFSSPLNDGIGSYFVSVADPSFTGTVVEEGVWYTSDGIKEAPKNGTALNVTAAAQVNVVPTTHQLYLVNSEAVQVTVDGFYAAFGTPYGAKYIPAENQIWKLAAVFGVIGIMGFLLLLFPLVDLLLKTKLFAGVKRPVVERENLPSIKHPAEWITLVVVGCALMVFAFFSYKHAYPNASRYMNTQVYAGAGVSNGVGLWSLFSGLFLIGMLILSYFLKRLLYGKQQEMVVSPFRSGIVDSTSQFLRSLLFGLTLFVLIYIPVYICYWAFNVDFRISNLVITAVDPDKLYIILFKYLPLWAIFYIPSAMFNSETRYKDMPEWLSTTICAAINVVGLLVFLAWAYGPIFTVGAFRDFNYGMAGITGMALAPLLVYSAFSARYMLKKTGNAWVAGFTNALIMCSITTFAMNYYTDFMFPV